METKVVRFEVTVRRPALILALSLAVLAAALALVLTRTAVAGGVAHEAAAPLGAAASVVGNRIHYQGRLEGASGPVEMAFRLWLDPTSTAPGDVAWEETQVVTPTNGLFNVELGTVTALQVEDFNGQALWLGVEVEGDGEMAPRQEILPVPYAMSLRPGASIVAPDYRALEVVMGEPTGIVAYAAIQGDSSDGSGVVGTSESGIGVLGWSESDEGVYGRSDTGTGVRARSISGVALVADGTGTVQSTADTTVWFPGTAAQIRIGTSGLTIYYHGDGIARLRASSAGQKQIVMPVVVPSVLYGQPVRVEQLELRWKCASNTSPGETIQAVRLYRSEGGASSRAILEDTGVKQCLGTSWRSAVMDLSEGDNVLSLLDGMLTFELTADMQAGSDHEIWLGGVRVRLGHDAS